MRIDMGFRYTELAKIMINCINIFTERGTVYTEEELSGYAERVARNLKFDSQSPCPPEQKT